MDKTVKTVYVRPRLHLGLLQHALTDHVHDAGKISTTAKHAAQHGTYFSGTGYHAIAINPIVARLTFLVVNIVDILGRQHVVYMYLSFECRQRTIRFVRVTFDRFVLQQYHS